MDLFHIRCSLWDIYSNYQKWWRHFMNNWWHFDIFREIVISPEPLIVWSHATPDFNQKSTTYGGNYIEVHHFENWKWLKTTISDYIGYFRVVCIFFVPLLVWDRITLQINQNRLIIVMVSLKFTLSNTGSGYNDLLFSENGFIWLISFLLNYLLHEVVRPLSLIRKSKLWRAIILTYRILMTSTCKKLFCQLGEEMFIFLLFITKQ